MWLRRHPPIRVPAVAVAVADESADADAPVAGTAEPISVRRRISEGGLAKSLEQVDGAEAGQTRGARADEALRGAGEVR